MSTTDLNVQSGLWQALRLYDTECGWTLEELINICHQPHHNKDVAAYFQPGSVYKLRNFIAKRPQYFKLDPSTDRVSLPEHSLSTVLEECLIEFMALKIKAASGSLDLKRVKFDDYIHTLPGAMIDHMQTIYAGSLLLFFKTHVTSFDLHKENRVKLAPKFESTSILADPDNIKPVSFFLGLLQKIGASKEKPCFVHTLTKYLHYMDADAREFLKREYHGNLNLFFLLNCRHFGTTKPERGSAYLKAKPVAEYSVVAYFQQLLQKENSFTYSSGLTFQKLLSKGASCCLPSAQSLSASADGLGQLRLLLGAYANIFRWQPTGNVCLRKKYSPWKEGWNSGLELLAVLYFIDILKDVGSASPSNPICFNYIVPCVESAPAECKDYLNNVFPGLDIINLFHLHPYLFDFSTANCVSLKCPPAGSKPQEKGSPEKLSARYAARLLRYAPKLTPDLLSICVETAPSLVRTYCRATVKDRLHSVIESGFKLLQNSKNSKNTVVDDIRNVYKGFAGTVPCEQVTAAEQVTVAIAAYMQADDKPLTPTRHSRRRQSKAEPTKTEGETDNGVTGQSLLEQEELLPSPQNQIPGSMSTPSDDRVLEYITRRLQEAPTHAENVMDLVAAVNNDVGPVSDYEILLAVLANEEALGFDGKQIYSKPKP
ncbi:unnamed protein product [Ixodes hexagonus]